MIIASYSYQQNNFPFLTLVLVLLIRDTIETTDEAFSFTLILSMNNACHSGDNTSVHVGVPLLVG